MPGNHQQPSSPIRAVIFDYGEVLSLAPSAEALGSMAAMLGVTAERFRRLYAARRKAYDRADLTPSEYWGGMAAEAGTGLGPEEVDRLRKIDVEMWSEVREDMLRWVLELRSSGVKTAMLSNMHRDMARHVRAECDWLANFDCVALSSELRLVKPDAGIYQYCLERLSVAPREALFLDDREANVRAAEALGITGIVARNTCQIRKDLQAIGFSPLPS
jgi:putative hydrolase of the HAD superfamily